MFIVLHGRERRTSDDGKHDDDDVDDDDAEDKPTAARPTKRFARPSRDRIETIGKRGGEIGRKQSISRTRVGKGRRERRRFWDVYDGHQGRREDDPGVSIKIFEISKRLREVERLENDGSKKEEEGGSQWL